ncbi:hypothetical protein PG291_10330 [Riemerella anatipestifer]|nr:hypothetical protein [Riemerella anatipestifer]
MRTKISFAIAIFVALMMLSCSKNKKSEELTIKPKTTQIKGDLGDYFEVVEKEYKIPIEEGFLNQIITVEVRRKDVDFPFDVDKINPFGTDGGEEYHVGFGIEFLGDNGPIDVKNATEGGMGGPYSSEDVSSLFKLKKGESGYIRWTVDKIDGLKNFQITSALEKSGSSNSLSSNSEYSDSIDNFSAGDSDIDKMLDDYERYVDQYIVYIQKASQGDMTALSEYPSLMEKAQELQGSLERAQNNNNFSAGQMKRMVAIQQKMTNAAIDMQYSN